MIPKTEKGLETVFAQCARRKVFVLISKEIYRDYRDEALADFASAQDEIVQGNIKWAIVKAYQALFLQCTALLVKRQGVYSKDHGCLVAALLKDASIASDVLQLVQGAFHHRTTLFEEIDHIRIFRNKALYFPKTQSNIGREEAERIIENVRKLIAALGEYL